MLRFSFLLGILPVVIGGCNSASRQSTESVTFYRDVAPILFSRCASCHRSGEAAPFSLLIYDDTKSRSGQIVEVTRSRFMPPWLPVPGHEEFVNKRRLSDAEIDVLARWHEATNPTV